MQSDTANDSSSLCGTPMGASLHRADSRARLPWWWAALAAWVAGCALPTAASAQVRNVEDQRTAIEARQLLTTGDKAKARALLEVALGERPKSPELLAAYADVLTVQGEAALANAARFKGCAFGSDDACRQLRLDPIPGGEPTSTSTLGGKCVAEGMESFHSDPGRAVDRFNCAVQAVPTSGYAHGALALALVRAGRPREAGDALEKGCSLGHQPSCARLELIADLRKEKSKVDTAGKSAVRPTHTLILHDGRAVSGQLSKVGGRYVVQSLTGTEEIPLASVKERFALVPLGEAATEARPWHAGAVEWGLALGYAANVQTVDLESAGNADRTLHLLSTSLSGGYFFTDTFELLGQLRSEVSFDDSVTAVFLQTTAAAVFHAPVGSATFAGGPLAGLEVGITRGVASGADLETGVGPVVGGMAGFKFDLGKHMGLRTGLSVAYAYAAGSRADDTSDSENRLRALFELELLWYPE